MFCKNCGNEIPNDSAFCTHCGKRQNLEQSVQPPTSVLPEQSISPSPSFSNTQYIKPQKPSAPFDHEYFFRMAHNNINLMYTSIIIEKKNPFGKVLMQDDLDIADLVDIEIVKPNLFTIGAVRFFIEQDGVHKQFTVAFEPWSKKKVNTLISVLSAHTGIQPKIATNQKQIVSKRALALYVTALLLFVFLLIPTGSDVPRESVNTSENTTVTNDALQLSDASVEQVSENAVAVQGSEATNKSSANGTNSENGAPSQSATASRGVAVSQGTDTNNNVNSSKETVSQRNAVSKAKSYISYSAFSREGLIAQLEYEKFSHEDAVYGADHCGANWNEQALKKAKSYLGHSAFSYQGLIDQLEYEKFTPEQAKYGVDRCGANWNEQAAKKAKEYLSFTSFSRDGLIAQLEYEKFTHEQAVYGAEANGL